MYLADFVVLPRAINRNEWLRYYGWSVQRWGPIQPPFPVGAGAGVDGTGSLNVAYPDPTKIKAGDLFLTLIGVRNLVSTPATPAGWTLIYGPDTNPSATVYVYAKNARATGSESGTVTWTIAAGNNSNTGLMFNVRGVTASVTFDGYTEGAATAESDNNTQAQPSVTTNGYGRLLVACCVCNADVPMAVFTGGTTTWDEVAEFRSTVGSDFSLQVQVSTMPVAGTSSGGSANFGTPGTGDNSIVRAFALVGT
jgi:hypothetical protein